MTLRNKMKHLGSHRIPRAILLISGVGLMATYYQSCAPMGDATGVGTTSGSLSPGNLCPSKVPPTITQSPGDQPAASSGLGRFSGNAFPAGLKFTIAKSYAIQAPVFECDVSGVPGLNVNDNDPLNVSFNVNNRECTSGTAVVTCKAMDEICLTTSNEVSFKFTVNNVCPAEFRRVNPDPEQNDQFGSRVAISGNTAVVIAVSDNEKAQDAGAAYVYNWNGSDWVFGQKLAPAAGALLTEVYSAAISGNTIVLGAPYHGNHGSAFVFRWNGTSWIESGTLTPSLVNPAVRTMDYGFDVGVSNNIVAVGAPGFAHANPASFPNAGAVFVYDVGTLAEASVLTASDRAPQDYFGAKVAVSGTRVAVGAPLSEAANKSASPGKAYVFDGLVETKLDAGTTVANGHQFGSAIAIDGTRVAVGAIGSNGRGAGSGAVYVFDGPSNPKKFAGPDSTTGDLFGYSVSLAGNTLAVGAPMHTIGDTTKSGTAYIFKYNGTAWNAGYKLHPRQAGRGTQHQFGESVGISGTYFVGGSRLDDVGALNSGTGFFIRIP